MTNPEEIFWRVLSTSWQLAWHKPRGDIAHGLWWLGQGDAPERRGVHSYSSLPHHGLAELEADVWGKVWACTYDSIAAHSPEAKNSCTAEIQEVTSKDEGPLNVLESCSSPFSLWVTSRWAITSLSV